MAFSVIMNVVPVLEDKSLKDRENLCELSLPGDGPSGQVLPTVPCLCWCPSQAGSLVLSPSNPSLCLPRCFSSPFLDR